MVLHMKTTLVIPDPLFRELKRRAVERGQTLSALVTDYLQRGLAEPPRAAGGRHLPPLPTFSAGRSLVDVADREALYDTMEER